MKGFYRSSKSWYFNSSTHRDGVVCDIMVGDYAPEGGCVGEFAIEWQFLGGKPVPQLRAWDDSWMVLKNMPELLDVLATVDGKNVTEEMMYVFLLGLGYTDLTSYTQGVSPMDPK
jgi:hypothetical protein